MAALSGLNQSRAASNAASQDEDHHKNQYGNSKNPKQSPTDPSGFPIAHGYSPFLIVLQKIEFERMQLFNISGPQNIIENNMPLVNFPQ
jgi:hypothetical protein